MVFSGSGNTTLPAVTLQNLTLDRSGGTVTLGGDVTVGDTLTLTAGLLDIDANDLILGDSATMAGTPSATSMIVADGTGEFTKEFPDGTAFTFPVGSDSGTPEYSPVTLEFTDGDFASASVSVRLADTQYSINDTPADYLERYWTVTQNGGITDFSCDVTLGYVPADIQGTETAVYGKLYAGSVWTTLDQAGGNRLTGTVTEFGDFTGADHAPTVANPVADILVSEDAEPVTRNLAGVFSDFDNTEITKSVISNNPSLVSAGIDGDTLTLTFGENRNGTTTLVIRGTANGKTADNELTVTVGPVDDGPVVSGTIGDVTVDEDAADTEISLSGIFSDIDSDVTKSVADNNNPDLVTAAVDGDILTLDYQENQNGNAVIIVQGTSGGKSAETSFTVTMNPVDDPPTVANPLADVTADEDETDTVISIDGMFTDIDSDPSAMVISVVLTDTDSGPLTAKIVGDTLVLSYLPDQHGDATVTVQAESDGLTVTDTLTVTVNPVDDPPRPISGQPADRKMTVGDPDMVILLIDLFTDIDNLGISIVSAESSDPSIIAVTSDGISLTLSCPAGDRIGEAEITVTAESGGQSVTETFLVTSEGVTYAVSGRVTCLGSGLPFPGVPVTAEGTDLYEGLPVSSTAVTDEDGNYVFPELILGEYTITPSPTDDPGSGGLSADDATSIARFVIYPSELDEFQQRMADVTGNGRVNGQDASRLARYANDLIPAMGDDPETPIWLSDPPTLILRVLNADADFQDFVVARAGDISGNWSPEASHPTRDMARPFVEIVMDQGDSLVFPVVLDEVTEIRGIDIIAEFDADVLETADVTMAGGILEDGGYQLVANTGVPGRISLGVYCPCRDLLTAGGTILFLEFDVVGDEGASSLLTLTRFDCNEIPVSGRSQETRAPLFGGLDAEGTLSRTLRVSVGFPYHPTVYDPDGDGRTGIGDAIHALRQGNLQAVIRILQVLSQASGVPR